MGQKKKNIMKLLYLIQKIKLNLMKDLKKIVLKVCLKNGVLYFGSLILLNINSKNQGAVISFRNEKLSEN